VKILYITSLSHSGSTLLDVMLNAHPDIISVGEVKQLGRFARFEKPRARQGPGRKRVNRIRAGHPCTCGAETLWSCPVWGKVSKLTEVSCGHKIDQLNVENYKDVDGFHRDNLAIFKAVAKVSGKNYIVDSSKHRDRLSLLLANPDLDVFPIFLLRNPKGQICSSLRKNLGDLSKLIYRYVLTNREIHDLVKPVPHAVVHYEQLVRHPERTLGVLMHQIGLEFDPQQLDWANQVRHNVGGNHMSWSEESRLSLDETWREKLSFTQKFAIDTGTLAGRYPFLRMGFR